MLLSCLPLAFLVSCLFVLYTHLFDGRTNEPTNERTNEILAPSPLFLGNLGNLACFSAPSLFVPHRPRA